MEDISYSTALLRTNESQFNGEKCPVHYMSQGRLSHEFQSIQQDKLRQSSYVTHHLLISMFVAVGSVGKMVEGHGISLHKKFHKSSVIATASITWMFQKKSFYCSGVYHCSTTFIACCSLIFSMFVGVMGHVRKAVACQG